MVVNKRGTFSLRISSEQHGLMAIERPGRISRYILGKVYQQAPSKESRFICMSRMEKEILDKIL